MPKIISTSANKILQGLATLPIPHALLSTPDPPPPPLNPPSYALRHKQSLPWLADRQSFVLCRCFFRINSWFSAKKLPVTHKWSVVKVYFYKILFKCLCVHFYVMFYLCLIYSYVICLTTSCNYALNKMLSVTFLNLFYACVTHLRRITKICL